MEPSATTVILWNDLSGLEPHALYALAHAAGRRADLFARRTPKLPYEWCAARSREWKARQTLLLSLARAAARTIDRAKCTPPPPARSS